MTKSIDTLMDVQQYINYTNATKTKTMQPEPVPIPTPIPNAHEHENEHEDSSEADSPASAPATATRMPWQDRLADLAQLASSSLGTDSRDSNVGPVIHEHLDAIESILRDPRPELAQEVSKCVRRRRSYRTKSLLGDRFAGELEEPEWLVNVRVVEKREMAEKLEEVLGEVTLLNGELVKRREESVRIQELYEERERGLRRSVAELEDEIDELRSDLREDAVELEGIQGTVHGLQHWIEGMREEQRKERAMRELVHQKNKRKWGRKTGNSFEISDNGEIVLEGLSAWMRGWRDVEDGFQARAQGRRVKREQRELLLGRNEIDGAASSFQLG